MGPAATLWIHHHFLTKAELILDYFQPVTEQAEVSARLIPAHS